MLIHRYESFEKPASEQRDQLGRVLDRILLKKIWCSSPEKLNDKDEFRNRYFCTGSQNELEYLAKLRISIRGGDPKQTVKALKRNYPTTSSIKSLIDSEFIDLEQRYRKDLGISCFSSDFDKEVLWNRYGGKRNGVCISTEIPDTLVGNEYRIVRYVQSKKIPLILFLKAHFHSEYRVELFTRALLTKTTAWAEESEIRYVSIMQNVLVTMNGTVKQVTFGSRLSSPLKEELSAAIKASNPEILLI